jgi:hypothetical protein
MTIGKNKQSSQWMLDCFGSQIQQSLANRTLSYTGFVLGSSIGIQHYLKTMIHTMNTMSAVFAAKSNSNTHKITYAPPLCLSDLAVHNYLYYTGKLDGPEIKAKLIKQGGSVANSIAYIDGTAIKTFRYACMYIRLYVCTYVFMYVYMYVCMHVYMYVRMYVLAASFSLLVAGTLHIQ